MFLLGRHRLVTPNVNGKEANCPHEGAADKCNRQELCEKKQGWAKNVPHLGRQSFFTNELQSRFSVKPFLSHECIFTAHNSMQAQLPTTYTQ